MEQFIDWSRYLYYAATVALGGVIYWVRWSITQSTVSQAEFDHHVRENDRAHAQIEGQISHLATKHDVSKIHVELATIIANQNQHAKQTDALIAALESLKK